MEASDIVQSRVDMIDKYFNDTYERCKGTGDEARYALFCMQSEHKLIVCRLVEACARCLFTYMSTPALISHLLGSIRCLAVVIRWMSIAGDL